MTVPPPRHRRCIAVSSKARDASEHQSGPQSAKESKERPSEVMPWGVKKGSSGKWLIYKKTTGKVVGHSDSKNKAQASVRAREAGIHKSGKE